MTRDAWKEIRESLLEGIDTGLLPPGTRLPTEPELCRDFGAGRHSVRRAILALAVEGRLSVEQGRGTFVRSEPRINYPIGKRTRFRHALGEQGHVGTGETLASETTTADERIAAALGLSVGADVHRLLRRGLADGVPVNLGLSFHAADRFPDMAVRRAQGHSVTDIYRDYGISDYFRSQTMILARRAGSEEARLLDQHPDQPVMVVTKIDVDPQGKPIGFSEAIWSALRVQFAIASLDDVATWVIPGADHD